MKRYIITSTIIHAALLLFVWNGTNAGTGDGNAAKEAGVGGGTSNTKFSAPVSVDIVENPIKGDGPGKHGEACPNSYGGIGVQFEPNGVVSDLAPNGPAMKAGIELGDLLIMYSGVDYLGEPGTSVQVNYAKHGNMNNQYTVLLIRETICYSY